MTLDTAAATNPAGIVERLQGEASATQGNLSRPLAVGTTVFAGDRIETTAGARVQLRLNDGAVLTLGALSVVSVEAVNPADWPEPSVIDVVRGAFLAATTKPPASRRDAIRVTTPSAVLGIRGTTVWGGQEDGRLGVFLVSGKAVEVATPAGTVTLAETGTGTDVIGGQPPTDPKTWGTARVAASLLQVAFE